MQRSTSWIWKEEIQNITEIWLKTDLYVRYRMEDMITPHHWSCLSELCMNFVVCILRHDFDHHIAIF